MNQEERHILIQHQVEKAYHFISQADEMMELGHFDLAVNRFYYACYHIVQALFLKKQIAVRTHSGIISQFSQHFVKTGIVAIEEGSLLARLFQLRQKQTTIVHTMFLMRKRRAWQNHPISLWKK